MYKSKMFMIMKGYCINVPPNIETYYERHRELEKLGLNRTRREIRERKEIREKLLEVYIKEGEDIKINRTWVKEGKFVNKNKDNQNIKEQQRSFEIDIDWEMDQKKQDIYEEAMTDIIEEYKLKRKKEAKEKKNRKIQQIKDKMKKKEEKRTEPIKISKPSNDAKIMIERRIISEENEVQITQSKPLKHK
jgi:hypothetical protein